MTFFQDELELVEFPFFQIFYGIISEEEYNYQFNEQETWLETIFEISKRMRLYSVGHNILNQCKVSISLHLRQNFGILKTSIKIQFNYLFCFS